MKIAITSVGQSEKSEMDQRFGRAQYFMVYDTETGGYKSISNLSSASAAQGAGIKTSEMLSKEGVETVITGHCGPKAFSTLAAAKIKVVLSAQGKVNEVVGRYLAGELDETDGPDVQSHWT
ncbi:MAG: NifB/NifX family molybdenum-iron cluster-binding protein [Candidatus Krumholzibacteriota bacterium]|nr:NifB/NifX family molybdenum-iron cluster-binding protein [Candidatus Krumholzibacteriota bacterium]